MSSITPTQMLAEHPVLELHHATLLHYALTPVAQKMMLRKLVPRLAILKRQAVAGQQQALAKAVWCLETVAVVQQAYLRAFVKMKKGEFYAAWTILEKVEKTLYVLDRHLRASCGEYGLEFIRASTTRFQALYPYKLFISPEIWKQEVRCGLCDALITLRSNCGHELNEIYDGERCYRRITKSTFLSISIVCNPVQKYSVLFAPDPAVSGGAPAKDVYPLARYVSQGLLCAWDAWDMEHTTSIHPHAHFADVSPDEECPCIAPQGTYAQCCLPLAGVLRPHTAVTFNRPPPHTLLKRIYV